MLNPTIPVVAKLKLVRQSLEGVVRKGGEFSNVSLDEGYY
jgi:hypothetical protein